MSNHKITGYMRQPSCIWEETDSTKTWTSLTSNIVGLGFRPAACWSDPSRVYPTSRVIVITHRKVKEGHILCIKSTYQPYSKSKWFDNVHSIGFITIIIIILPQSLLARWAFILWRGKRGKKKSAHLLIAGIELISSRRSLSKWAAYICLRFILLILSNGFREQRHCKLTQGWGQRTRWPRRLEGSAVCRYQENKEGPVYIVHCTE